MTERKYKPEDLHVLDDPVATIRKRPDLYLPHPLLRADLLASLLASDLSGTSPHAVAILQHGEWWVVASEEDWIERVRNERIQRWQRQDPSRPYEFTVREYFNRIIAFPEYGVNCFRSEVLLTAFTSSVVTASRGEAPVCIVGTTPGEALFAAVTRSLPHWQRLVAFEWKGEKVRLLESEGAGNEAGRWQRRATPTSCGNEDVRYQ